MGKYNKSNNKNFKERGNSKKDNKQTSNKVYGSQFNAKDHALGSLGSSNRVGPSFNDPSWYLHSPDLVNSIAKASFNSIIGFDYDINTDARVQGNGVAYSVREAKLAAPSVLAISYVNSIGVSNDAKSPTNIAAQAILSYMRSMAKVRNTYEKTDVMIYLLANDSIYSALAFAGKLIRCARVFNSRNREVGKQWIESMGVEVPDLRYNLKDYALRTNILIDKIAQMRVPSGYPIFERHIYMTKNIFRDVPDNKLTAQTYLFVPQGFHRYNATAEGGGALEFVHWWSPGEHLRKMSDLLDLIETMVDAIVNDEDTGNISGDIDTVFGSSNCYTFGHVSEDEYIETIYDSGLQTQIENMRTFPVNEGTLRIYQASDESLNPVIYFKPAILRYQSDSLRVRQNQIGTLLKPFLNMHWMDVTPSDLMYATRLMPSVGSYWLSNDRFDDTTELEIFLDSTGTEIVTEFAVYGTREDTLSILSTVINGEDGDALASLYELNSFDWHPVVIPIQNYDYCSGVFMDLDNYTLLDSGTVKALNDLAMLSVWKIPSYGINTSL